MDPVSVVRNESGIQKAHHPEKLKKDMASRLSRIEGQIRGISKMIGEDVYCDDVLYQVHSVEMALNGFKKVLLAAHVKSCIVDQLAEGKNEVVDELLGTIGIMIR